MWRSVNDEGHYEDLLHLIINHRFNKNAIKNGYVYDGKGNKRLRKTTRGVQLQVTIKNCTDSNGDDILVKRWVELKDIKESHLVEVAEYAVTHKIDDTPAFAWWVPYTLKKRDRIIAAVKSRITKATHKYGIEVPRSVAHAKKIDRRNGKHLMDRCIG